MEDPWEIQFNETDNGKFPARDFLDSLENDLLAYTTHRLKQLQLLGRNHPDIRPLKEGLFEFKIKRNQIQIRFLFFYQPGNLIIITNGFRKTKRNREQQNEIKAGRGYMKTYLENIAREKK